LIWRFRSKPEFETPAADEYPSRRIVPRELSHGPEQKRKVGNMGLYTFRSINKNQLGWHSDMGGDVLEWMFMDGWMDNGYKYGALFASHLDMAENIVEYEKKDWPIVNCHVTSPDGETKDIYKAFPPEEFKAEPFGVTIGNNFLKGSLTPDGLPAGYQLKVDLDDIGIDVTAEAICTGVRFTDEEHGCMFYDPTTNIGVGWWPLVPRASLEGTVTFQGKKTEKAAGHGYVERQLGNREGMKMNEWVSHWYWGHCYAGDYTAIWNFVVTGQAMGYHLFSPLVVWKGSDIILSTHNLAASANEFGVDEEVTGNLYPTVVGIHGTQGDTELFGLMTPPTLTERYQMLNLPGQTLENPGCVLRGFCDINLEITQSDDLALVQGKCMYEHGQIARWVPIPKK